MKRRIYWSLCLISLAALLLSTAASLSLYYHFYEEQSQGDLRRQGEALSAGAMASGDAVEFLQNFTFSDEAVRITLLNRDGTVLFDSEADPSTMENHLGRPEVQQALNSGSGQDSRISDTLGLSTFYYAVTCGDDMILRLGRDNQNLFGVFLQIFPLDLLSCAVLFVASLFIARTVTRRIVTPLTKAADNLESLPEVGNYDELEPFLIKIRRQNRTIRHQLNEIQQDRDTITMILENMQEGMVILNGEKKILSVNRSAMRYLHSPDHNPVGKPLVALTRNIPLLEAVEKAHEGESNSGIMEQGPQKLRYFVNPVLSGQAVGGVIMLVMDVTEQYKAQKEREDFSANVSHELKTPLTTISGFAEMMKSGMVQEKEEMQDFSSMIYVEARRLLSLIDDIMRLSRIEEGREELNEPVALLQLAKEAASLLESEAERRNIEIQVSGDNVTVPGNSTMLYEMIRNLCENAVKYNKEGGKVWVTVKTRPDAYIALTVKDTGIGIPKKDHERIFERFYRVDKSRSKETGGTGLGLSIVKHIVERHHGQIHLTSEEGKGCCMEILLPEKAQTRL